MRRKAVRYEVRDEGPPGLLLWIGKKGDKDWEAIVSRGGKRRRIPLGKHTDMTVGAAGTAV